MSQNFIIDNIDIEKLEEALSLVWKVFSEFEAPDYNQEGIQNFKEFIDYSSIHQKLLNKEFKMFTCSHQGKIIGVLGVRNSCHISMLFVDSSYHRKGIARSMVEKMIEWCKENENHTEITVNSSPYAVEIYHRLGFCDTDKEQVMNGIRYTPMKRLI